MLTEIHNMEVVINTNDMNIVEQKKKTRRGKKKTSRHRPLTDLDQLRQFGSENSTVLELSSCQTTPTKGYKPYEKSTPSPPKFNRNHRKGKLRPSCSPKAPPNDNKFLIEDHLQNKSFEGNLNLRMLFDDFFPDALGGGMRNSLGSPEKDSSVCSSEDMSEPEFSPKCELKSSVSSPFNDFDFEYTFGEDDLDSRINFYEQDFEEFYKNSREAELATLSRDELIESVVSLEKRLSFMEKNFSSKINNNTNETLQNLMSELKMLQEENQRLKGTV